MSIRFVTKQIHAYLDYPVALALMGLPFILQLGSSNELALWLSVVTGFAALLLTILTDHHLGVIRVLPYSLHLAVDLAVGVVFALAPFILGFEGIDAIYYWANGIAVLCVVSLHKPEDEAVGQMA
ncbi:SPW repeat domain-containing protein [Coralliovum pocilloporae]|uniref:SPW repeat domain-containing protein n=1 Tax=Coralliovum pocilloporae TaxID=3066369 RepID=UPI00330795C0